MFKCSLAYYECNVCWKDQKHALHYEKHSTGYYLRWEGYYTNIVERPYTINNKQSSSQMSSEYDYLFAFPYFIFVKIKSYQ